ncbi:restriction endonuclease subunit S [Helicobacter pylori]|uniref:restriction endonuclease subunit S n=2 Tax=Helicobacter pylori TaxID=210 RepID=UPI0009889704|nr:restriction endonuclease subunit S [Helicobacter pylori]OOC18739.1 type I restriction endonuclease [Helicobacter pylori]QTP01188.1 restriction endonuclease subunit S [Helicobacter pylori]WQU36190.1 restriction endonuclease subunit S [Helicobacter pylori]
MIGPLSSQLNAIKWGEFKLGDLFEIYTGSLLSQEDLAKGDIVRISVKSDNNGVYGHFDTLKNKKARHFENFISVNFFGNCFYHPYLASVEMKVHVLKLKNRILTRRVGLFLANQLNKCFYGQFTYGTQLSSSKLKHNNFKIQLPLKPTANTQTLEDIDFTFMEKFIAELEQCRLAELEAYLKATGLENTTLSNDEENALNVFNGNNSGGGNTPCGLTWQLTWSLGLLQMDFFYRKKSWYAGQFMRKITPKAEIKNKINSRTAHYFTTLLNALKRPLLSVLVRDIDKTFREQKIQLPLKPTAKTQTLDDVDFHFMHTLINALMKQTIQGVVQYCSAKIQATKEVISQEAPVQKDSLF